MASILPDFEYDIFISYRQNDNKYDGWVTEFVDNLQKELDATLKNPVSIYFDENPHDGLQDTHVVDESLKKKLKSLIFIPIISQTYCDENSFAWQHEFLAFNKIASADELGMNITLANGNVASRVLPIRIHDIDTDDQHKFENVAGSPLRSIDFIYKEAGVNRSLKPADDKNDNLNNTSYRNQLNKVAHALKDLGTSILNSGKLENIAKEPIHKVSSPSSNKIKNYLFAGFVAILALILGYWGYSELYNSAASLISDDKSIAVLPFTNMSSDKDQDYFCDGIAEDILNDLAQLEGLRVAARTSSFAYKDKGIDIREIGDKLGVTTVLEGSVQKSGNILRVTAQLINVADGYHLWSKQYDREMEDVFVIKDEISQNIVTALAIKLSNQEKENLDKPKTQNVEAYDYYIRGRYYFNTINGDKIDLSIRMFNKAIEVDSNYALAYAGLANCYSDLHMYYDRTNENLEQALTASKKALNLDPGLAEAHVSRGYALFQANQKDESEKEFKEAIKVNPKLFDAYYLYGLNKKAQGNHVEAIELFKKAAELEPENYNALVFVTTSYGALGLTEEMTRANNKTIQIFRNHLSLYPEDERALYLGAGNLVLANKKEEALQWIEKAVVLNPDETTVLYNAACVYSLLGRVDEALNYLDRSIESGYASKEWLINDNDLDNIRDSPRFQEIVDKIK